MSIHHLKTWPEYWIAIRDRKKNFEVRKNDRNFRVGDILKLREYDPIGEEYTGRVLNRQITYILDHPEFCKDGYVILSIE